MLTQRPELAFAFTSREVATFGRYPVSTRWRDPRDREIVDAALALADAFHLADREVVTLSGGEQARVHLAAAFAQLWETEYPHPRFLLLDEPTAALDLAHQHALLATARAFAAERNLDRRDPARPQPRGELLRPRDGAAPRPRARPGHAVGSAAACDDCRGFGVAAQVLRHPLTEGMLIATAAMR